MHVPQGFIDSIVNRVRSQCAAAFGDSYDVDTGAGTCKFFTDYAAAFGYPYAVIVEVGEQRSYMTRTQDGRAFLADGSLQISVLDTDRPTARTLADRIGDALNDCDEAGVNYPDGRLTMVLVSNQTSIPVPDTGVGTASVFHRILTVTYEAQGMIP